MYNLYIYNGSVLINNGITESGRDTESEKEKKNPGALKVTFFSSTAATAAAAAADQQRTGAGTTLEDGHGGGGRPRGVGYKAIHQAIR